jgi:serine/threonine protein kinase/tetratricopeptide (TPR) repeat protein
MSRRGDNQTGFAREEELENKAALPAADYAAARSLKRDLLEELKRGWREGQPVRTEELLARWPGNPGQDPDVASILFEEFCQRRKQGASFSDRPSFEEFERRFPSQRDSLASLFRQHEVLRSLGGGSGETFLGLALPAVGDEVFGFHLRYELGRGAFARVFLAEQAALAGRPVVVKVSAIEGEEPQTLAQLQHTHIVPIYSVHEDARAGVRAVCMPYFGGASLSRVLHGVWSEGKTPTSGEDLLDALAGVEGPPLFEAAPPEPAKGGEPSGNGDRILDLRSPVPVSGGHAPLPGSPTPPASPFTGLSYVQATAWIVNRLAEGLQHAHDRGVLHCDIKPSNILLGGDCQPMLLDFNLAQKFAGVGDAHAQVQATLGGTVAYMAPEHLRALATRDPALARLVDQRTDIYALGMVLFEMLTGERPFDQSASYSPMPALIEAMAVERSHTVPSLRSKRPDVPWSLESICRKCLAPVPAQRYQSAGALAEDLRRFLADQHLRYAPELSWKERGQKWVRRHPRLAVGGTVSAVASLVLLIAGGIFANVHAQWQAVQARERAARESQAGKLHASQGAEARQRRQQFAAGVVRALCLVNTAADMQDLVAQGEKVCKDTLDLYGVLDGDKWQSHPDCRRLSARERLHLAEDVRELLLLLARARVRLASTARPQPTAIPSALAVFLAPLKQATGPANALSAWVVGETIWKLGSDSLRQARRRALHEALALLERGEAIQGLAPSSALWRDRADYRKQLGDEAGARAAWKRAEALPPVGARDHYLLATTYSGKLQHAAAVAELNRAVNKNPRDYWSWFQRGLCFQEQGAFALALGEFSACIALWPEFAWGYFNRGRILHQMGKNEEACRDYSSAHRLDRDLVHAYLNRGLVHLDLGRYRAALADLDAAARRGVNTVVVRGGRGIALEHLGRHRAADWAFASAWKCDPNHAATLLGYAFAVAKRLPAQAGRAFRKVLEREPRNPHALYGLGMLFSNRSPGSDHALFFFNQAVEAEPTFLPARRGRALVLSHRREGALACQEVDWCVATEPNGVTLYAAACVYALRAANTRNAVEAQWTADRAIALLREAIARGYGKDKAAKDVDLKAIWRHKEFHKVISRK